MVKVQTEYRSFYYEAVIMIYIVYTKSTENQLKLQQKRKKYNIVLLVNQNR